MDNLFIKLCFSCFIRNEYKLCSIKMIFDNFENSIQITSLTNQIKNKINENAFQTKKSFH